MVEKSSGRTFGLCREAARTFDYKKQLKYYLDFCQEYKFNQAYKGNLPYFLNELRKKNQTGQQQEQASDAISKYYETGTAQLDKIS